MVTNQQYRPYDSFGRIQILHLQLTWDYGYLKGRHKYITITGDLTFPVFLLKKRKKERKIYQKHQV